MRSAHDIKTVLTGGKLKPDFSKWNSVLQQLERDYENSLLTPLDELVFRARWQGVADLLQIPEWRRIIDNETPQEAKKIILRMLWMSVGFHWKMIWKTIKNKWLQNKM